MVMDHVKVQRVPVLYRLKCDKIFWLSQLSSRYYTNLLVNTIGKKTFNLLIWLTLGKKKVLGSPANQKQVEVKRVLLSRDEQYDMIVWPTLPKPAPNYYILSKLKICYRNVSKCYGCGGAFYKKVIHKKLMILLSSQSFVGSSLIQRRRS